MRRQCYLPRIALRRQNQFVCAVMSVTSLRINMQKAAAILAGVYTGHVYSCDNLRSIVNILDRVYNWLNNNNSCFTWVSIPLVLVTADKHYTRVSPRVRHPVRATAGGTLVLVQRSRQSALESANIGAKIKTRRGSSV
ncbi:hypothetical protein J6590_049870 [Homalodisca vitripennis]|nr:hypothetical protein J6590_049870 [Homalodisca vitripennis]